MKILRRGVTLNYWPLTREQKRGRKIRVNGGGARGKKSKEKSSSVIGKIPLAMGPVGAPTSQKGTRGKAKNVQMKKLKRRKFY